MPSGSSSSDLSAMSLDVSFKDLSGVLGTVGSGSGVVCEGGGEERKGRRKGGWEERDESEEREGEGEKRETRVKQHCRVAAVASQEYSLLCPIWGPTHMESYQS